MAITIFEKIKLSPGTMTDFVHIQERIEKPAKIGSMNSTIDFINKWNGMTKLEVVKPTFRFEGVNIPAGTTHLEYMPFDNTVFELDGNSFFVKYPSKKRGLKERYFKLEGKINFGEQDEYLLLYLRETGFSEFIGSNV